MARLPTESVSEARRASAEPPPPLQASYAIRDTRAPGEPGNRARGRSGAMGEMISYPSNGSEAQGLPGPGPRAATTAPAWSSSRSGGASTPTSKTSPIALPPRAFVALAPRPLRRHRRGRAGRGGQALHGARHRGDREETARRSLPAQRGDRPPGRHRRILHGRGAEPLRRVQEPLDGGRLRGLLRHPPGGAVRLGTRCRRRCSASGATGTRW